MMTQTRNHESMGYIENAEASRRALESVYHFFVGDYIAHGISRYVYELNSDPATKVVKICTGDIRQNVLEDEVWYRIRDTEYAKWFAPVHHTSLDGRVMIQARTTPVTPDQLPAKVPAFFTDLKASNWGMIGKRVVCHDYGLTLLMENGMTKRMRKAEWW